MTKGGDWDGWQCDVKTDLVLGTDVTMEVSRKGKDPENDHLEVTFYMGEADGKPVIQVDGDGDFRINVNEGVVFDRSTEENSLLHEMALAMYHEEVGMSHSVRYNNYELVKIRNELIQAGYSPAVVDSNGTLPEPDPFMWVIVNRTGPDMRRETALCNEKHMHSDNVDEAWGAAVFAGTRSMNWVTLTEAECLDLDIECTKCKQERLVNLQ
jgi:hypothetical protein